MCGPVKPILRKTTPIKHHSLLGDHFYIETTLYFETSPKRDHPHCLFYFIFKGKIRFNHIQYYSIYRC